MQMRTRPPRAAGLRPANHGRRIERERRTIAAMIGIYCRDHHGQATAPSPAGTGPTPDNALMGSPDARHTVGDALHADHCPDCAELLRYANQRLDVCVFGESKMPCNDCSVHCYSASRRGRIVEVMRYAGPRMPWRHPLLGLMHLVDKLRARF